MARTLTVCNCNGCPTHDGPCPTLTRNPRCPDCTRQADKARGTPSQRGYGPRHRRVFRQGVLAREPFCRLCHKPATIADHHPTSRRDLQAQGLDPDDPQYGRGLCKPCHDRQTAQHQPGGWNANNS